MQLTEGIFILVGGLDASLWFLLEQDIDMLNGSDNLVIGEDGRGHDVHFGLPRQNFGRGMLITRHTDWQNFVHDPVSYVNFLTANATTGANTRINLFEEGENACIAKGKAEQAGDTDFDKHHFHEIDSIYHHMKKGLWRDFPHKSH
jgi:hypothetical protein